MTNVPIRYIPSFLTKKDKNKTKKRVKKIKKGL